jgi:transcriptional regulator with XRE-family HTH domain
VRPNPYCDEKGTKQSVRIGERLVNLRKLSQGLGFSHSYLSHLFAGHFNRPSSVRFLIIAHALDMTTVELEMAIQQRKEEKAA